MANFNKDGTNFRNMEKTAKQPLPKQSLQLQLPTKQPVQAQSTAHMNPFYTETAVNIVNNVLSLNGPKKVKQVVSNHIGSSINITNPSAEPFNVLQNSAPVPATVLPPVGKNFRKKTLLMSTPVPAIPTTAAPPLPASKKVDPPVVQNNTTEVASKLKPKKGQFNYTTTAAATTAAAAPHVNTEITIPDKIFKIKKSVTFEVPKVSAPVEKIIAAETIAQDEDYHSYQSPPKEVYEEVLPTEPNVAHNVVDNNQPKIAVPDYPEDFDLSQIIMDIRQATDKRKAQEEQFNDAAEKPLKKQRSRKTKTVIEIGSEDEDTVEEPPKKLKKTTIENTSKNNFVIYVDANNKDEVHFTIKFI